MYLENERKKKREKRELRYGLVRKIHKARREAEQKTATQNDELLELASQASDQVLYTETNTLELLNFYFQYRQNLKKLAVKHASFLVDK